MMSDLRQDIPPLLARLVGIDSVNPSLVPGGAGEREIAAFVEEWLQDAGVESSRQAVGPGRENVIGRVAGSGGGRSLMLNAHMDTVGLGDMESPLELRIDGDRAFARGAYDMKGSLAAIMLAGRELAREPPLAGDLVIAAVADEEHASAGTQHLLRSVTTDAAVVTEPTDLEICVAHKGFAWIEVETEGRAAHGSRPDLGHDAIASMGHVLVELSRLNDALRQQSSHELLGCASLHASLIHGGQELSSYPDRCILQIERRTLPGETEEQVAAGIQQALAAAAKTVPGFRASANVFFWRDAFESRPGSAILKELAASILAVRGRQADRVGETPWMDSAFTRAAGIDTVVFGPAGAGAHAGEEWVSLESIAVCAEVLIDLVRRYCC